MEFGWYVEFHRQVPATIGHRRLRARPGAGRGRRTLGARRDLARRDPPAGRSLGDVRADDRRQRDRRAHQPHQDRHRGAGAAAVPSAAPGRGIRDGGPDQPRPADDGCRTQRQPARLCRLRRAIFGKPRALLRNTRILKLAWTQPSFSYEGKFHSFNEARAVPRPYQQPHPPIRIAGASEDTFPVLGKLGYPLFVAVRSGSLAGLAPDLKAYREAYTGGRPSRQRRRASAPDAACRGDRRAGARASRTEHHAGLSQADHPA